MTKPYHQIPGIVRQQIELVKIGLKDKLSIANLQGYSRKKGSLIPQGINKNVLMLSTISKNCGDKLISLDAGYNDLVRIPDSLGNFSFPKLKHLDLEGNNLTDIPNLDILENLPELTTVNLKNNPLSIGGLLKIKDSSKIMYILDEGCKATLEKIKSSPQVEEIARICVNDQDISSKEFEELLPLIDAQMELQKILKTSIPNSTDKNSDILFAIRTIRAKLNKNENSKPNKNGNEQKNLTPILHL